MVYLSKLTALTASIFGGYGTLKLYETRPFYACIYAGWFFEGMLCYNVLYNSVYELTHGFAQVKETFLNRSQGVHCTARRREEYKRVLKSIPGIRIRAGVFSYTERESTLIFLGFVFQKIVDLLLTSNSQ